MMAPLVTIVLPCRDEEGYVGACLDSIIASDYPQDRIEVLVVDGMSKDRTREIVQSYALQHSTIRLLDNPQAIAPTALNRAIRDAKGSVIMRMDAHVVYPQNYVSRLVAALEESGADNVGGVIQTLPADGTPIARAIAVGLSHRLGVGNSYFRIGVAQRRWVETVPFGCYRREVFERIGLFDEELVRNQDDEFNYRLIKSGGRVLLLPDVVAKYYARGSLRLVSRMFYQYGYFKPLVARKVRRVMTVRQLIPAAFVLTILSTALLSLNWPVARIAFWGIFAVYAGMVLGCAAQFVRREGGRCALALSAVFPLMHFSYGLGWWMGVWDHFVRPIRRRPGVSAIPLSR